MINLFKKNHLEKLVFNPKLSEKDFSFEKNYIEIPLASEIVNEKNFLDLQKELNPLQIKIYGKPLRRIYEGREAKKNIDKFLNYWHYQVVFIEDRNRDYNETRIKEKTLINETSIEDRNRDYNETRIIEKHPISVVFYRARKLRKSK